MHTTDNTDNAQLVSNLMRLVDAYAFDFARLGKLAKSRREVESALEGMLEKGLSKSMSELMDMLKLATESAQDARKAGRAEALEIIMRTDPEVFADEHTGSRSLADTGDFESYWQRDKLADLLECAEDSPMTSLLDRLEGAYWDAQGHMLELNDAVTRASRDAASALGEISPEQCDWLLDTTTVPGGSTARAWFLPHEGQKAMDNIRLVVKLMFEQAKLLPALRRGPRSEGTTLEIAG